jgi:hypothetical protein
VAAREEQFWWRALFVNILGEVRVTPMVATESG